MLDSFGITSKHQSCIPCQEVDIVSNSDGWSKSNRAGSSDSNRAGSSDSNRAESSDSDRAGSSDSNRAGSSDSDGAADSKDNSSAGGSSSAAATSSGSSSSWVQLLKLLTPIRRLSIQLHRLHRLPYLTVSIQMENQTPSRTQLNHQCCSNGSS